jgi:hypothetical protein
MSVLLFYSIESLQILGLMLIFIQGIVFLGYVSLVSFRKTRAFRIIIFLILITGGMDLKPVLCTHWET